MKPDKIHSFVKKFHPAAVTSKQTIQQPNNDVGKQENEKKA
jgi:hypothetical protein